MPSATYRLFCPGFHKLKEKPAGVTLCCRGLLSYTGHLAGTDPRHGDTDPLLDHLDVGRILDGPWKKL